MTLHPILALHGPARLFLSGPRHGEVIAVHKDPPEYRVAERMPKLGPPMWTSIVDSPLPPVIIYARFPVFTAFGSVVPVYLPRDVKVQDVPQLLRDTAFAVFFGVA